MNPPLNWLFCVEQRTVSSDNRHNSINAETENTSAAGDRTMSGFTFLESRNCFEHE